jgi:hypothetical protein
MTTTECLIGIFPVRRFYFQEKFMVTTVAVTHSKPRPALKLVKTNDLSRNEWLEVRKTGIGSSDAAASVGLNP